MTGLREARRPGRRRSIHPGPLAILLIALAACGGSAASPAAPSPSAPASPVGSTSPAPVTPPSSPDAQASATPDAPDATDSQGGPVDDCAVSTEFQLAYEVPGMDAIEVTCGIAYKQIAGAEATLDLYLPPDTAAGAALPAVVFVHGNFQVDERTPIDEHWKRDQYTAARVVAALGYAAISFDYRGYSVRDRLADAEQDVLDLLAYVGAHASDLQIDPDRICLWSVSGGGLPAAWASIFGDPRPVCAVLISAGFWGAPPAADPIAAIGAGMPPVFLARGEQDGYANPDSFVEAATAAGVAVTVETHPGGHGWEGSSDPEQQRIISRALDFVVEHLGEG